jgi:choline dehydrogenase
MSNSGIYMSLPNMTTNYMDIVNSIHSIITSNSAPSYLPTDYASDPTLTAGYIRQLSTQATFYANTKAPSVEVPFATGLNTRAIMLHPLSRGTVRLNLTDPLAQPILDYRGGSNPIDLAIHMAHLKFLRRMFDTPSMRRYGAMETEPGLAIQSDEALAEYVKESMTLSFMHPCCTAAMMPRELGGVVGPDLKVHGVEGLRVVDISVLPLLVSSHTSSTAYAVGEKVRFVGASVDREDFSTVLTFDRLLISLLGAGRSRFKVWQYRGCSDSGFPLVNGYNSVKKLSLNYSSV